MIRTQFGERANKQRSRSSEFVAVLIAGFGEELRPLTSDHKDETSPKSLLGIGNRPLISFPLAWLEEGGVTDVLLLCPESHANAISNHLASDASSSLFPKLSIVVRTFTDSYRGESVNGTASVLAQFTDTINSDFIIVPCDFVPPPSLQLSTLLDRFRMDPSGLLMAALFYETAPPPSTALVPGDEPDPPPTVLFDDAGILLKIDDDADAEELDVRMEMLWAHPRARLRTDLRDAHVYVCKSDVATLLSDDVHRFQSIRSDFIPWLVEIQHRARRRTKWAARLAPVQGLSVLEHSTAHAAAARNPQTGSHTPPAEDVEGQKPPQVRSDAVVTRCALLVHTLADGPARRVNTLTALLEANRAVLQNVTFAADASHVIENQTQISPNVILGSSTRVGERTTLKQSVIGAHCTIGKNVRITGSVVMDHCVIQDGAKIEGCILGPGTTVGEKTQLTQCFTQPGYEVAAGEAIKGEKLDHTDDAWNEEDDTEEDDEEGDESEA